MDTLYRRYRIANLVPYGYGSVNAAEFSREASGALQGSFSGKPVPFDGAAAEAVVRNLV
jgi:alcohol dehydrogenase